MGVLAIALLAWSWRQALPETPVTPVRVEAPAPPQAERAKAIAGTVRDARGGPVAGAFVSAFVIAPPLPRTSQCDKGCGEPLLTGECPDAARQLSIAIDSRAQARTPFATAVSDAIGHFSLSDLRSAESFDVWAQTAQAIAVREDVRGDESVDLTLAQGRALEDTVYDAKHEALGGASVLVVFETHRRVFETHADRAGHFLISPLPEGGFALLTRANGFSPEIDWFAASREHLETDSIFLSPARTLAGYVVSAGTHVPGVTLSLTGAHLKRTTITGDAGEFAFESLRVGAYEVHAAGTEARANVSLPSEHDLRNVRLTLRGSVPWSGEVVDDVGMPISGARVSAMRTQDEQWTRVLSDTTGHFDLGLLASGEYRVFATHDGFRAVPPHEEALPKTGGHLHLVLHRETVIEGIVVDTDGKPVGGAQVFALVRPYAQTPTGDPNLVTKKDGRFIFILLPGTYDLSVYKQGYIYAQGPLATVVSPASNLRLVLNEGSTVSGSVLETDGGPAQAVVELATPEGARATVDATIYGNGVLLPFAANHGGDGAFTVTGVPPGEWIIYASDSGTGLRSRLTGGQRLSVGSAPVTGIKLQFKEGETLAGHVFDAEHHSVANAPVTLTVHSPYALQVTAFTKDDGAFLFTELPPGTKDISASHSDRHEDHYELVVQQGTSDLNIELPAR